MSTHQLLTCPSLPQHWIVRTLADNSHHIVPALDNGWPKRTPYRGHVSSLSPATGYNYMSLGIPIIRDWPTVCRDPKGYN